MAGWNCNNSYLACCFFFCCFFCCVPLPGHRCYPSITSGMPYFLSPISMEVHTLKARAFHQPKPPNNLHPPSLSHPIFLKHKALVNSLDAQISLSGSLRSIWSLRNDLNITQPFLIFYLLNSGPVVDHFPYPPLKKIDNSTSTSFTGSCQSRHNPTLLFPRDLSGMKAKWRQGKLLYFYFPFLLRLRLEF